MQINKFGNGPWPEVVEDGTSVTIKVGEDSLTLNCLDLQREVPVVLDIVKAENGDLVVGTQHGQSYVANISIPASKFHFEGEDEEMEKIIDPLTDLFAVDLNLWTVEKVENNTMEV